MLHHTIIPWSPERMRRLIFSLICSSSKAANLLKPTSFGMTSSQIRRVVDELGIAKLPPERVLASRVLQPINHVRHSARLRHRPPRSARLQSPFPVPRASDPYPPHGQAPCLAGGQTTIHNRIQSPFLWPDH